LQILKEVIKVGCETTSFEAKGSFAAAGSFG